MERLAIYPPAERRWSVYAWDKALRGGVLEIPKEKGPPSTHG